MILQVFIVINKTESQSLKNSEIYFEIHMKSGKGFYINDIEYRNKYDEKKRRKLKIFLQTAQAELGFRKIRKKKFDINSYWYSVK